MILRVSDRPIGLLRCLVKALKRFEIDSKDVSGNKKISKHLGKFLFYWLIFLDTKSFKT